MLNVPSSPPAEEKSNDDPAERYRNASLWFYGNISRVEAEQILIKCQKDTFLVRTSSKPGNFALSKYFHTRQSYIHFLVSPVQPSGYVLVDSDDNGTYPTICHLLAISPECTGFSPAGKFIPPKPSQIPPPIY